ncbi:MAG: VOC family protein [Cyanosarcina radialis HA8281-LM2]|jgi:catechol-2,3-dioxygenase|nr:VOC family protein [Cyanosarcina radialis HA8281-LM2]
MNLIRFEHINLSCHDLDRTQQFYQTIFPDWYVRVEGISDGTRWMHLGNNQFYLAMQANPDRERVHRIYEDIGINHVGFVIDDGEAMKSWLDKNAIEYYTMTSPETKHRIYVTDPDGNEVELVEYNSNYALK